VCHPHPSAWSPCLAAGAGDWPNSRCTRHTRDLRLPRHGMAGATCHLCRDPWSDRLLTTRRCTCSIQATAGLCCVHHIVARTGGRSCCADLARRTPVTSSMTALGSRGPRRTTAGIPTTSLPRSSIGPWTSPSCSTRWAMTSSGWRSITSNRKAMNASRIC